MAQYLDKFNGTIGKRQAEQVLKVLNKKRNTGQIRSVQEFSKQLESLMRELTSTKLQPSLKLWLGEQDQEIDSETYNFMLDRIEDDLSAAFEESTNVDEIQKSHEAIIRDVILKNLRAGVAELESKVSLFEFINKDVRGFDAAIFSTFRESKAGRTQRQGSQAQLLFTDPRQQNELIPTTQDAEVELIGERLVLALDSSTTHTVRDIRQIFDSNSPQSELVVEPPGTSLQNIIDNTQGTYWIQSLLFSENKTSVKTKLELNLGGVKEVNVIEIEPASRYGIILEAIHYLDRNNIIIDLEVPEQTVDSPVAIRIKKIATDRIILTFRNENSSKIEFEYNPNVEPLFSQAISEPAIGIEPTTTSINDDLDELIGSTKIKDIIGVGSLTDSQFSGYEFLIGIDNIRVGITKHEDRSIYISTPLSITGIGELGILSVESRPYLERTTNEIKFTNTTYDIEQDSTLTDDTGLSVGEQSRTLFQGSIEYWVIKQDLNTQGSLSRTSVFPILPLDVDRVEHERLVLDEKSTTTLSDNDLGWTMFYTTSTDGNIKVYRNGILLEDNTGVPLAGVGWTGISEAADRTPNNRTPMRFKIQVLDRLPGDIFTVSYNPVLSSTNSVPKTLGEFTQIGGLQVVDLVGDLTARVNPGQIIGLDRKEIITSNIYLAIILRQNAAESTLTPAVEEYTLVAGSQDSTKFEEF